MIRRVLVGLALALPAVARAQLKELPPPVVDPNKPSGFEFRVGGIYTMAERDASVRQAPGKTVGGYVRGYEGLLRGGGGGIQVKYLEGSFYGMPELLSADANLILMPRQFSLVGGVGRRALTSNIQTQIFQFARAGVSSSGWIGGTGMKTELNGAFFYPFANELPAGTSDATATKMNWGAEAEATVIYSPPHVPFYVQVGYRSEVFRTVLGTGTTQKPSAEIVRGIRLGGGIQFGGK